MGIANEILGGIDKLLITLSNNKRAGRWFVVMIAVALATVVVGSRYLLPTKKVQVSNPNQCDYLMEQNKQLVNALLEIKSNLQAIGTPVSYNGNGNGVMFASYIEHSTYAKIAHVQTDTVPRAVTRNQYQQAVNKVLRQIDSVLIRNRLDSLKKVKQRP